MRAGSALLAAAALAGAATLDAAELTGRLSAEGRPAAGVDVVALPFETAFGA